MAGILSGIRVVDLTQYLSGPQATLFLAGLGAEVIHVDNPATGDVTADSPPYLGPEGVSLGRRTPEDLGVPYLKRARGKRAITLNLKHPEGSALLLALVRQADVVVENWSVGTATRLGVDYAACRAVKPDHRLLLDQRLRPDRPGCAVKAYDTMAQAAAGLMSITGDPEGPPMKAGSPLADTVAGTFAFAGILAALLHRFRSGEGQHVDVSMVDCLLALVLDESLDVWQTLGWPTRQGNRIPRGSPFNVYPTADGWIAIGTASDAEWSRLLDAIDRADLKGDANFISRAWRLAHNDRVIPSSRHGHAPPDRAARPPACAPKGVACGPIRDIDGLKASPAARGAPHAGAAPPPDLGAPAGGRGARVSR